MAELGKPEGSAGPDDRPNSDNSGQLEETPPTQGRDPGLVVAEVAGLWLLGFFIAPKLRGSPLPIAFELSPLTWACLFGFCGLCEGVAAMLRSRRSALLRWLEFLGETLVTSAGLFLVSIALVRGAGGTRAAYQIPPGLSLSYTTWLGLIFGAVVCKTIGERLAEPWERATRALFAFVIGAFTTLYLLAALDSLPSFPWGPYIVVLAVAALLAAISASAYRDFLAEFPQSVHAAEAARRLAEREREESLEDQRRRLEEEQRRAAEQQIEDLVEQYEQLATLQESVSQVRRQLDAGAVNRQEPKAGEVPSKTGTMPIAPP